MAEDEMAELVADDQGDLVVAAHIIENGRRDDHVAAVREGVDLRVAGEAHPAEAARDRAEIRLEFPALPQHGQPRRTGTKRILELMLARFRERTPLAASRHFRRRR